jgi:phage baseplate assembly protein W
MTDVPHFALPFRFVTGAGAQTASAAVVTEQDSIDEIAACVLAILLCPIGFRVELPTFGIPDQAFATPGVDEDRLRQAIETWEPRAAVLLDANRDAFDALVERIQVLVQVRTEE